MRNSSRTRISRSTCAAMCASRSVSSSCAMNSWASERLISATSAMFAPCTSTARTSGFSRLPSQTGQGISRRYSPQRARWLSVSACANWRSM
ncbi:hypothetical protein BC477_13305 [Clavibacter michiganensis subsp. michiganensis]|uniref:Secreted protein n=1 Tax=Clavibacter michiganensis subsp. michiganensis TaxID=33013 RepID=A0A251XIN9_CLAMM|nr:hypothetical protein BC477_13305 [Clavibacter michiganensis subsp. michiganensis]OUE02773.1 hypothetical protein CMMCAS07_12210 [Clavibacter michiganensis subsp. michiganensis]